MCQTKIVNRAYTLTLVYIYLFISYLKILQPTTIRFHMYIIIIVYFSSLHNFVMFKDIGKWDTTFKECSNQFRHITPLIKRQCSEKGKQLIILGNLYKTAGKRLSRKQERSYHPMIKKRILRTLRRQHVNVRFGKEQFWINRPDIKCQNQFLIATTCMTCTKGSCEVLKAKRRMD